jgi:hypothetical protein
VLLRHCRSLAGFLVENEATNELSVVHNAAELLEDKDVTKVEEVRVHEIHHRQGGVDGERTLEYRETTLELRAVDADLTRVSLLESSTGMAISWRT